MKLSIVTLSLLGASAAVAAPPVKEARCTEACMELLQPGGHQAAARVQDSGMVLTSEPGTASFSSDMVRERGGVLTRGYQSTFDYQALAEVGDPFRGGLASQAHERDPRELRADDSIAFQGQGRASGLKTGSRWSKGDIDGSPAGRAWGMTAGIKLGALTLRAAHQNRNVAKITRLYQPVLSMTARNSILAANMRFKWGTAYAAYSANRGWGSSPLFNPDNPYGANVAAPPSTDSRDVLVGVAVPANRRTTLLASYIHRNDRDLADRDARQLAVGATYAVSRRLDFYAAYSHVQYVAGSVPDDTPGSGGAITVGMRRGF